MSVASKCLQVLLALLNLAFLVFGIVVLAFAVTYLTQSSTDSAAYSSGIALAAVGSASIVIGIFGCVGSFCRSRCALIVYSVFLVCLIVAACVTGGLMIATSGDSAKIEDFGASVWSAMNDEARIQFQNTYKCCGYAAPWDKPASTCPLSITSVIGCRSAMVDILQKAITSSSIILFVAAGCQLFAVIISLVLIFDDEHRKSGYGRAF